MNWLIRKVLASSPFWALPLMIFLGLTLYFLTIPLLFWVFEHFYATLLIIVIFTAVIILIKEPKIFLELTSSAASLVVSAIFIVFCLWLLITIFSPLIGSSDGCIKWGQDFCEINYP
jgi:O-antigen ligase